MEQKKFVKFGLSTENFRAYVAMIEEEVEKFLDSDTAFTIYGLGDINEWGRFPAKDKMSELTILTASRTLQGKDVREGLDATFAQRYDDLDHGFTPVNLLFPNLPLASNKRRDKAQQEMSDFFVDILRKREKEGLEVNSLSSTYDHLTSFDSMIMICLPLSRSKLTRMGDL
jgi:sterol 14-demethylase